MRIFLIQFGDGPDDSLIQVAEMLQAKGHEIVYWVKTGKPFPVPRFPKTIFHDSLDALHGVPAPGVDTSAFAPPGKDVIERLYETESLVLTMMNKHHGLLRLSERKHLYYQMVRYWSGVIEQYKPDAIVFPIPPHAVYDFILYALAKPRRIRTLMFYATEISDRLFLMDDFTKGGIKLARMTQEYRDHDFSLDDISADLRKYYDTYEKNEYVVPLSIKIFKKRYAGTGSFFSRARIILKSICDLTFFSKIVKHIARRIAPNLKKEYERVQTRPDFAKRFIYFPLQYQPEMTTSPLGGVFADQRLAIEILSATIPSDWMIYVKEHPMQWGIQGIAYSDHRYAGYYAGIAAFENVAIIPIDADTHHLMNAAEAVATNTGTIGREAVLRLKPAIIFGHPWYQQCPGLFRVHDIESCKTALKIIMSGFSVARQEIINYLACLDRASIHGYLDPHNKHYSHLSEQENAKNLAEALLTEME